MASEKEAAIFIVDCSLSMGKARNDRDESDLDWSLRYVWDKITNIVAQNRKTLFVGVIGLSTDKTKNHMMAEDGYERISVLQDITNMQMTELRELKPKLVSSNTDQGDALSAVILAVDMIMKHCKHLQYKKEIYLITNGSGQIDGDDIESTAAQIKQSNIKLTVLGVDFDDKEIGVVEKNKSYQKAQNEALLKRLVDISDGAFGTMYEAIEGLKIPFIKPVRPIPTYKGQLRLGDPDTYDTAITIDIERYAKVMVKRAPTASSYVAKDNHSQAETDDNLATVRAAYTYSIKDDEAPGGRRDIPREELEKGYEYGRTAVHIAEAEENITKLETTANYEILGFVPMANIERYMLLDSSNMLVAQKANDKAALALSSLVHALYELSCCAVARFVKKNMAEPQLTLLSPHVTTDIECLIENDLPFAEDIRQYRFPPIDKFLTVSGKVLTQHRNLPDDKLLNAMSDFVDNMSLMTDDNEELLPMDETFSPLYHTIEAAIKHRAVHPNAPLEPKNDSLLKASHPPPELIEKSRDSLAALIKAADVKKVPPKVKGRRKYRGEAVKPLSGLDVDALLRKDRGSSKSSADAVPDIDPKNAVPDFKRAIEQTTTHAAVDDAVRQMFAIVEKLITDSFGDRDYERAVEMLGVVRQEIDDMEFGAYWNKAIRSLREKVLKEELGGNRKEFWWRIRVARLGLLQDEQTKVGEQEAKEFLTARL